MLEQSANNGFAKAHLGFIAKTTDNDLGLAIMLLSEGMESGEAGTDDARFYFHLGDAYNRIGQSDKVSLEI